MLSCTKIDIENDSAQTSNLASDVTQKFFSLPANASPALQRIAVEMKTRNDKNEFVKQFVSYNGYPVWNKMQIIVHPATGSSSAPAARGSGNDTIVILPIVAENADYVNGFISVTLNGNITYNLYRGGDYDLYTFNNVPADSISAEKAAVQMVLLNHHVFGYTKFKVNDKRLFRNHFSSSFDTTGAEIEVEIHPPSAVTNALSYTECNEVCVYNVCTICGEPSCPLSFGICWETCTTYEFPDGGGGGGTPSGGGGDPPPPPPFPCPSSQSRGVPPPTCGPTPFPQPIVPIPTQPQPSPCSKVYALFQNAAIKAKYVQVRNERLDPQESAWSYTANGTGGYYSYGLSGKLEVNINYPPLPTLSKGSVHCHNAGGFPIFSLVDIKENLCGLVGGILSTNACVGMVSPSGDTYILTVQDINDFATFADNLTNDIMEDREKEYELYIDKTTSPGANMEKSFLEYLEKYNSGLGVVKANANFTEFTELKLVGNVRTEVPCAAN